MKRVRRLDDKLSYALWGNVFQTSAG